MIARRAAVLWGGWLTVAAVTGLGIGAGWVAWERPLPGAPVHTADDGTGEHSAVQTAPCSHEDPAATRCATTTAAAEPGTPSQQDKARPARTSTSAARPTPRPAPRESRQPQTSAPPESTPAERDQEEVGDSGGRSGAPSPSSSATSTPDEPEPSHEPESCPTTTDDPDPDTDEAEACDE